MVNRPLGGFFARQKSPGAPAVRLHERSRFVREAER